MFSQLIEKGFVREFTEFDPEKLKDFDPEIIADFRTESLVSPKDDDNASLAFIFASLQFEDLYLAIKYAQTEIIPNLKTKSFKANDFLNWINQINAYAAATLALDHTAEAGKYVESISVQWKLGNHFMTELRDAILNEKACEKNLTKLYKKHGLSNEHAKSFSKLIKKLRKDEKIIVPDKFLKPPTKDIDISIKNAVNILHKINYGMHQNAFSTEEKAIINEIIKIRMLPEKIPAAMDDFTNELYKRFNECDGSQAAIVKLAAFAFRELTEIHPFFNGNGRTSFILINAILVAFGKPSILMRTAEDEKDSESTYNLAIKHINSDISYLEKHIDAKLEIAKKKNQRVITPNAQLELYMRKESLMSTYALLEANHKHCTTQTEKLDKTTAMDCLLASISQPNNLETLYANEIKNLLVKRQKKSNDITKEQLERVKTPTVPQSGVNFQFAVQDVVAQLKRITRNTNWKSNKEKGAIWLPGLDAPAATQLVAQLQETEALEATFEANKVPVVIWVKKPNLEKLKNLPSFQKTTLESERAPAALTP